MPRTYLAFAATKVAKGCDRHSVYRSPRVLCGVLFFFWIRNRRRRIAGWEAICDGLVQVLLLGILVVLFRILLFFVGVVRAFRFRFALIGFHVCPFRGLALDE